MEEKLKPTCPLLLISRPPSVLAGLDCKEEECAWFVKHENPKKGECAIKALADSVKYMTMRMKI